MSYNQNNFIQFLEKPQKDRDSRWEEDFLQNFPQSLVTLASKAPQLGPDQFPYMFVEIKEDSTEPAINLLHWIAQNGVGLAVNPKKTYPDFVFTYGMIWNFVKFGKFLQGLVPHHVHGPDCNHHHDDSDKQENIKSGDTVYMGTPSDSYLPQEVRKILKEFLKQQGILVPKITMLSMDQKNFDLCFSMESFGSPDAQEHEGILQAISWFLPAHYSLAFVSESGLPPFENL